MTTLAELENLLGFGELDFGTTGLLDSETAQHSADARPAQTLGDHGEEKATAMQLLLQQGPTDEELQTYTPPSHKWDGCSHCMIAMKLKYLETCRRWDAEREKFFASEAGKGFALH